MDNKINFKAPTIQNSIDIKSYIYKIISYWKLFLVTIITALIIANFMSGYVEKKYSLNTIISVKEENNPLFSTGTNIAFNWGGASDEIETIKVILGSRSHNEKVVEKLKFYIAYLKEGRYRMEDVFGYTPFTVNLKTDKPQLYNKLIKVEITGEDRFKLSFDFNALGSDQLITYDRNLIKEFISETSSFSKEYKVGEIINTPFLNFSLKKSSKFNIGESYFIKFQNFDGAVSTYRDVSVRALTDAASLLSLSMSGPNKKRIVAYLNATVQVLEEDKQEQKILYARKTKKYIDELFIKEKDSLGRIQKELGVYKEVNNIFDLSSEGDQIFSEIVELEKEKKELLEFNEYLSNLKNYLSTHSQYSEGIPVPALIKIQDVKIAKEISILIQKSTLRESLRNTVTDDYPPLKKLNNEIAITKNNLLENITNLLGINNTKIGKLNKRLTVTNSKLKKIPTREQGLLNYQRNFEISESNYNYLKQKSYEAGTAIAANVSDVKIIDEAKDLGEKPNYPKPQFNYLVGLMMGIIIPLFYIIIREILDNKIHTADEIQNNYAIPVLGVVGRNQADNNLAVFNKPKSSVAESFRTLRSNIQFLFKSTEKEEAKTLVLTSSVSGEGKTMISINMATVFALSGKKTVLIGLDLRKPKIYDDFDLTNDVGVVNHLINQKTLDEIIIKTKIPNLDLILSGPIPPNPSELLLNETADKMIKDLQKRYDYVVIDTPPVGLVSDALELFKYGDAIIYVIRQNYSEKGMMKMIDEKYINKEVSNICYVLNDFSINNKYGYGYSYGYGYGYGYGKYGYHEVEESNGIFSKIKNIFKTKS
ncbi:polysaccharide biosynthesis tyrosine autokinase [uncultured Polaribacter sp.]|uniref:polysaccharide biosynthesis tyrosine autokinase n=1 Tax=uncultured Polaribacter sp. TaxID=174711 RepID=UPI00260C3442|nr:polysaccharide biosynthesis tyrosine autokinase [uncultured Polaribacter sp.]